MLTVLHLVFAVLLLPALLGCLYLLVLTLLSWQIDRPECQDRDTFFDILVPAHNEEAVLEGTLRSLLAVRWPLDRRRVIVIADNCTDATAEIARRHGVVVIERHHETLRGKGYALEAGIARSRADGMAQAVVVVDADTEVSANLLEAFAARLQAGSQAIQANYGVLNPDDSWRTRLVTIAYGAFHAVRSRSRQRLGVSCGLRGNGMCLSMALLAAHPLRVYSMTEDLEYGILLGLAGIRVDYADEADALALLPSSGQGADSQRQRWEKGRFLVLRAYAGVLSAAWLKSRSRVCLDLLLDLLVPPIGYLVLNMALVAAAAAVMMLFIPSMAVWLAVCAVLAAALALHILRGWQLCPLGPSALLELLRAPWFILWKILALLRYRKNKAWIKTEREDRP